MGFTADEQTLPGTQPLPRGPLQGQGAAVGHEEVHKAQYTGVQRCVHVGGLCTPRRRTAQVGMGLQVQSGVCARARGGCTHKKGFKHLEGRLHPRKGVHMCVCGVYMCKGGAAPVEGV